MGSEKVHVVVGLYQGCLDGIRVARIGRRAAAIERKMCGKYGVPFGPKRRQKYYDSGGVNEVHHMVVEIPDIKKGG